MSTGNSHRPLILKVGGSLLDWPEFKPRLAGLLEILQGRSGLLIIGGGDAADVVRRWDIQHSLSIELAHRLAIHSMSLTARFVAELLDLPRIEALSLCSGFAILDPAEVVLSPAAHNLLPASWDVTSDSIALWVASQFPESEFVFLKSTEWPDDSTLHLAANAGLVDPYVPVLMNTLANIPRIGWINLRGPDLDCRWIT